MAVLLAPGVEFNFTATAGPQVGSERAYELARMQLMAFFYFLTFDPKTRAGGFWRGKFIIVMETPRNDWGNPVMRGFADAVVNWDTSLLVSTADGFFKAAIRRHTETACRSWGLEWNMKFRIVGFFGEPATAEAIIRGFPKLELKSIGEGPSFFVRYHIETPLPEGEDRLFYYELPAGDHNERLR